MPSPDISILIANYNNGRENSLFNDDIIGDCLRSIRDSIDSPLEGTRRLTWECLIWDDGSTDSGIESIGRIAHDDARFRLFRDEHIGRVGAVYNRLMQHASASICVRMDGDTVTHTRGWGPYLLNLMKQVPQLGMIGPVQRWDERDPDPTRAGRVRCFRCWLWTPDGRRNPWRGMSTDRCENATGVCDYVSGSWVAYRSCMWHQDGGIRWDEEYLSRGEDLDWFVNARLRDWHCVGSSTIRITHRDTVRQVRGNRDNTSQQLDALRFMRKWGFDHYHPDVQAVGQYGRCWNACLKEIPADARW